MDNTAHNDRSRQLGQDPIGTLLVRFSVPAIIGMMVQSLYNIVDRIFIGQGVGALGLAGATVGFPFMLIFMAFGMLVGIGGNTAVSIALGEGRKDYAERVLANALVLMVAIGATLTAVGLTFLHPLLRLFGASETIMPYAAAYMRIILFGVVINGVAFGMNNFIRGEGNPRVAMTTMLIGAVLNTILDPIFIFGLDLGIRGAALATIISQGVAAAWILWYYLGGSSTLKIRLPNLRPHRDIVVRIVALGSAPFAMQLAASALNVVLNNQLQVYGGDLAISAMGIIYSVGMLILMPIFGLNQGSQPIIGYNYGARRFGRVRRASMLAIAAATTVATLGWLVTRVAPDQLVRLFNADNPELRTVGAHGMTVFFFVLPLVGFQIVAANYFQAVGKPRHAMFLGLSRQVIVFIPMLLILPPVFGLAGVYAAAPTADLISAVVTGLFFFRELRTMKDDTPEREPTAAPAAASEEEAAAPEPVSAAAG